MDTGVHFHKIKKNSKCRERFYVEQGYGKHDMGAFHLEEGFSKGNGILSTQYFKILIWYPFFSILAHDMNLGAKMALWKNSRVRRIKAMKR